MCGICGDGDGDVSNDMTTKDGVNARELGLSAAEQHTLVGNSWQIPGDTELGQG